MPKKEKTLEEKNAYKAYQKYIASPEFEALKKKALERDGYRCVCCGRSEEDTNSKGKHYTLNCHHRSYEFLGYHDERELADVHIICGNCHREIHMNAANYKQFKFTEEWIKKANEDK